MTDVVVPKWGLTMEDAEVLRWLKAVGDTVTEGEPILELETDKATGEVEAPASGVLAETLVEPGAAGRARAARGEDRPVSAPAAPVRLSRLRRKIGSRLRESVTTKPPVTLHTTAPAGGLRTEGGPGVTALVAEAAVGALTEHQALNGWIADDELTTFAEVHLGIAVDTFAGLVVPVVRDAQLLDAAALGAEIARLAERARAQQLTPEDVLDATFTLTTLGAFGVEQFTPIVNPPQVAVLGVGAIRTAPALRDGAPRRGAAHPPFADVRPRRRRRRARGPLPRRGRRPHHPFPDAQSPKESA